MSNEPVEEGEESLGDFEDHGAEDEEAPGLDDMTQVVEDDEDGDDLFRQVYDEMVELIPPDELGSTDAREVAEAASKIVLAAEAADNPIGLDPRVGVKDLCFDRGKPGAKVYVVAELAPTVEEYYEAFPDAPAFEDYAANVLSRFDPTDRVLACVYVKDSLTKVDTNLTAYPMPESRLTRFPAEAASMVGGSGVEFERTPIYGETDAPVAVSTGVGNWPDIAREKREGDYPDTISDGGVTEDDLREATEEFFDEGVIQSVGYSPERDSGIIVVEVEEVDAGFGGADTFDLVEFEETLNDYGFAHTGYAPAPDMTQVNVSTDTEE